MTADLRRNFDGKTVLDLAMMRLHEYEPPEGYWLAFSGGKDSIALLRVAEMAGVKFDAHYSMTTIDPPELVRHIRQHYPQVAVEHPEHTFSWWLERKGVPVRTRRWCCQKLKEAGGRGRFVATGIRAEESATRKRRSIRERSSRGVHKEFVHPILDWQEGEIWSFIRSEGLPYPTLYDEGWKRVGCVLCPFAPDWQIELGRQRWPGIFRQAQAAIRRGWARNDDPWPGVRRRFSSAAAVFEWWIGRDSPWPSELDGEDCEQGALFV